MEFFFSKYSGCGNDFVIIDDREERFPLGIRSLISKICHRNEGIGADGVILLQKSSRANYRMRILNPDGSEAEMCGNGIRCLVKFIQEIDCKPTCTIETLHQIHRAALDKDEVSVEMGAPKDVQWELEIPLSEGTINIHSLNTGVPHAVEFVNNLSEISLQDRGPAVRHHPFFAPKGTNYSIAQILENDCIAIQTYERGVEKETRACGTGATAAALAGAKMKELKSPVKVRTASGETLKIYFEMITGHPQQVWLAGPAHKIYSGSASYSTFYTDEKRLQQYQNL